MKGFKGINRRPVLLANGFLKGGRDTLTCKVILVLRRHKLFSFTKIMQTFILVHKPCQIIQTVCCKKFQYFLTVYNCQLNDVEKLRGGYVFTERCFGSCTTHQ